jgi:hypothetical protein
MPDLTAGIETLPTRLGGEERTPEQETEGGHEVGRLVERMPSKDLRAPIVERREGLGPRAR